MLFATLLTLAAVVAPADAPPASAPHDEVRLAQDEFGDPPPPPPPVEAEPDVTTPAPPPAYDEPAPAPQPRKKAKKPSADDTVDDGEPGFIEKYFPFGLPDDLHPAVDEIIWSFWVSNLIPCIPFPQIWLPMVVAEDGAPDGYLVDAIITYILHVAPHLVLFAVGLPLALLSPIPWIGWFIFLPCSLVCNGLNVIGGLVNAWYLLPVALASRMDAAFKLEDAGARDAWLYRRPGDALAAAPMAY